MTDEAPTCTAPVVVARAGVGVVRALADAVVATKAGRALHPVTVVVPSGNGLVRLRRELAATLGDRLGGVANLQVTTLAAIARDHRPVDAAAGASRLAVLAAVGRAAAEVGGPFGASAEEPATLLALAGTFRELREGGDRARRGLAGRGRVAGAVGAITARATALLHHAGLADEVDRLDACRQGPAGAVVLVVDRPLTPASAALAARLLGGADAAVVVAALTGDDAVDAATSAAACSLSSGPLGVGPSRGPADGGALHDGPVGGSDRPSRVVAVTDATDPDAEVRDVVRALRRSLLDGADAARCALVWTSDDPYRRLVTEHLDRTGIPWSGPTGGSLAESRLGRQALALAAAHATDATDWAGWATAVAAALPAGDTDQPPDDLDPVRAVLAELGRLDRVRSFPVAPRLRRTRAHALLELALATTSGRRGARGVLVGPLDAAPVTSGYDVVAVLGLAEGWVPRPGGGGALLTDADRAAAGLPAAAEGVLRQRRSLFGLLAAGTQVHLSWPRGDLRRTVERHPSRWLDDLVSAAGSSGRTVTRVSQPSHLGALAAGTAASPGDQRLALALAEPDALADADPRFAAGRRAVIARRQPFATAYDGNLGDEDLTPLQQQRVWTASELEQYLDCPRTFFVRYVLGVRDDEPVDELLTADARREGTVIHRALQTVMIGERDAPPTDRPTLRAAIDDALTGAEHDAAQRSIANGQAPATVPALIARHRRRSLLGRLNKVVDEDRTRRTDGGRQVHLLEHGFGFDEPVAVTLPSGRSLAMKGRIDRIDRRPDGSAVVIDYKRRSRPDGSHVLGGRGRLQVAMYAAAARQVFGADEVGAELVSVADARIHTVDGATLAATGPLVELIIDAVEAGRFWPPQHPPRGPGVPSCSICDPYGLFDRLLAHRARAAPT